MVVNIKDDDLHEVEDLRINSEDHLLLKILHTRNNHLQKQREILISKRQKNKVQSRIKHLVGTQERGAQTKSEKSLPSNLASSLERLHRSKACSLWEGSFIPSVAVAIVQSVVDPTG